MHTMHEHVNLPHEETQPLVHPLDLHEARGPYRTAEVLGLLASPEFLMLIAGVAWWLTDGYLAPVLAVLSTGVCVEIARRHHLNEAWANIPRRRQDHGRPDPAAWAAAQVLLRSAFFVGGLLAVLAGMRAGHYSDGVRDYALGSVAALLVLMVGSAARQARASRVVAAACAAAPSGIGVAAAALADLVPSSPSVATVLLGASGVLLAFAAWWLITRLR